MTAHQCKVRELIFTKKKEKKERKFSAYLVCDELVCNPPAGHWYLKHDWVNDLT